MSEKVVFRLKRYWLVEGRTVDLSEEIRSGRKRIEYRIASDYWLRRLLKDPIWRNISAGSMPCAANADGLIDLTKFLKVKRAWLIVGMPKNNLPRFEADVTGLFLDLRAAQLQTHFSNVVEKIKS